MTNEDLGKSNLSFDSVQGPTKNITSKYICVEQNQIHQLSVAELIGLLKVLPPDLKVWYEGCDCLGKANGIKIEQSAGEDDYVLITRGN